MIVFVHGGAFIYGSALPAVYGPEKFMSDGSVILVTLQYRVGALGFLSTGDCDAPGNVGLKDQNVALRWVKENIDRFGGDPELITLAGESAGGMSVQLHMMSPRSKGLFQRAIMMSGSALIHTKDPPDMAIRLARLQLAAIGLNSVDEMTSEQILLILRSADAATIVGSIMVVKVYISEFYFESTHFKSLEFSFSKCTIQMKCIPSFARHWRPVIMLKLSLIDCQTSYGERESTHKFHGWQASSKMKEQLSLWEFLTTKHFSATSMPMRQM